MFLHFEIYLNTFSTTLLSSMLIIYSLLDSSTFSTPFMFSISLLFPCDRCLEEVQKDFHIEVEREFDMKLSDTERIEALDETNFISGNNLDVDAFVYGEILLNLPMKVLCRKDCKGICNRCGTNLNLRTCTCDTGPFDPRMSVFQEIFNEMKEV